METLIADEVNIVSDQRFTWKGRDKLVAKSGPHKFDSGYQLVSYAQLSPPAAATSTDLRSDWHLFAVGTSYGFILYDYSSRQCVVNRCTLNVQDFAIVSGDLGPMSRKKSFRKSLRESFRRLRRGRSQRNQMISAPSTTSPDADQPVGPRKAFSRPTTTGVRAFNAPSSDAAQQAAAAHRNLLSGERQVEPKVELSSIVKCITLTSAIITNNLSLFKPSLWVGTNSGQVLVYAIDLDSEVEQNSTSGLDSSHGSSEQARPDSSNGTTSGDAKRTVARLTKEIQLKHKAPIVAIFTSPEAPSVSQSAGGVPPSCGESAKNSPEKGTGNLFERQGSSSAEQKSITNESESNETSATDQQRATSPVGDKSPSKSVSSKDHQPQQQPRVLICSEEQFKVFNLPNLKPFCKFKLTAYEGLRAKKISITQFLKPASTQNTGNTSLVPAVSSSTSKLQSSTTLNSSKSLQSFATQTSPSASPVPPASSSADGANDEFQQANGAGNKSSSASGKQTAESNNNTIVASNNNSQNKQQDKELLNAKFGAKANSPATTANTSTTETKLDDAQQPVGAVFEPYMVCLSNQGDCAIYSVPDLKRQAQIQVCKREDVNGITSAMLTNYGEGFYLRSSSNFLRFSISSQRVLRVLSVV